MTLALPVTHRRSSFEARYYQLEAKAAVLDAWEAGAAEAGHPLLVMATGCHEAGQGVLMFDGSVKAVEDVRVGDQLMGPDSAPRNVLALARGEEEMVEIVPTKGEPWRVNRSHILSLVRTAQGRARTGGEIVDVTAADWLGWGPERLGAA